jgi:hypothetical protein
MARYFLAHWRQPWVGGAETLSPQGGISFRGFELLLAEGMPP